MQLIGLILLIATSWYIFKLTSNFLDEETKKELSENYEVFKNQLKELTKRFSKENLDQLWKKYKKEAKSLNEKEDN